MGEGGIERAADDTRRYLFGGLDLAGFVNLRPCEAKVSNLRAIVFGRNNGNVLVASAPAGLLHLTPLLRGIELIGEPPFGERLDLDSIRLGTVRRRSS